MKPDRRQAGTAPRCLILHDRRLPANSRRQAFAADLIAGCAATTRLAARAAQALHFCTRSDSAAHKSLMCRSIRSPAPSARPRRPAIDARRHFNFRDAHAERAGRCCAPVCRRRSTHVTSRVRFAGERKSADGRCEANRPRPPNSRSRGGPPGRYRFRRRCWPPPRHCGRAPSGRKTR